MESNESVRDFMIKLALDMKRDPKTFEPFIQNLEKEWFDTVSSLKLVTPQKFDEMGIPKRLQIEIQSRLNNKEEQKEVMPVPKQNMPENPIIIPESPPEPKLEKAKSSQSAQSEWELMLMIMRDEISIPADHKKSLEILKKVINNLLDFPGEKKFRTIKLSNEAIAKTIGKSNAAISFLQKVFFNKETSQKVGI